MRVLLKLLTALFLIHFLRLILVALGSGWGCGWEDLPLFQRGIIYFTRLLDRRVRCSLFVGLKHAVVNGVDLGWVIV